MLTLKTAIQPVKVELPDGDCLYVRRLSIADADAAHKKMTKASDQRLAMVEIFWCDDKGEPCVKTAKDRKDLEGLPAELAMLIVEAGTEANAALFQTAQEAAAAAKKASRRNGTSSTRSRKKSSTRR